MSAICQFRSLRAFAPPRLYRWTVDEVAISCPCTTKLATEPTRSHPTAPRSLLEIVVIPPQRGDPGQQHARCGSTGSGSAGCAAPDFAPAPPASGEQRAFTRVLGG